RDSVLTPAPLFSFICMDVRTNTEPVFWRGQARKVPQNVRKISGRRKSGPRKIPTSWRIDINVRTLEHSNKERDSCTLDDTILLRGHGAAPTRTDPHPHRPSPAPFQEKIRGLKKNW